MKRLLLFTLSVLLYATIFGQETSEKSTISDRNSGNRILQFKMDMPKGVNGEQFVSGTADIPLMTDLAVRLERFYTRFGDKEQVSAGLAFKYFLTEKTYLITGAEIQYNLQSAPGNTQRSMSRLNIGIGQEVRPNLFLELGYKPRIGVPNPTTVQGPIMNSQNSFFLKARF